MEPLHVRGACPHDCPDTCAVITEVVDGQATGFRGDPDHPITRGWLCAKVRPYLNHVYHPDRLTHPLRRKGAKGRGQWQQITWEEALQEIRDRWAQIIRESGPEAILPYSYSGTLGLVQMVVSSGRFWNRLGASQLQRSICGAAAEMAVEATLGNRWAANYDDVRHSKLVILWGHNPVSTAPHFMPFLREAQRSGCQVVVIDPRRTGSAAGAMHLAIRPGTDGYLALGIAHWLVQHGYHDAAWLEAHTVGWPALRDRLTEFPLARVAQVTGLPQEQIEQLAHLYGSTRPGLIKMADGVNRNVNGGQNVRAICTLPAITGQYGTPGGGLAYSTSGYVQWDSDVVHKWSACPPPGRSVNMNRLGAALLGEVADPPIRSLFVFGANPAASTPSAGKIIQGLMREDLFTVVHELFMTDTAAYADLVLPATSQLEHVDLHKAYGTTYLTYNAQAIPPRGACKSTWEVMTLLAQAMEFTEPWLHQSAEEVIQEMLTRMATEVPSFRGITLERLKRDGHASLQLPPEPPFAGGQFPTPSGKVELFSATLAKLGHDPLPGNFQMLAEESSEESNDGRSSFTLVTAAGHHFVSSTFANHSAFLQRMGTPFVEIHPDDALGLGIATDDPVELWNLRGSCQLRAVVTDAVRPGVLASPKGYWGRLSGGRNVNWLTTDQLADFAGQSCYHSTRVQIRKLS
ncbi:MAG: molybdopterin oxidoreductase family protein [Gemmataceae bacterium]